MTATLGLLILFGLMILVARVWLLIIAFRTSAFWGCITLLVPFGSVVFARLHWAEARGPMLLGPLAGCVFGGIVGLNPDMLPTANGAPGSVAHRTTRPSDPPREAHDLAENTPAPSPPAPKPPADPFAVQRAAYLKHNADLTAEYQRLNTERATLKPGTPAVAAFNAKAAHYQSGLQTLQEEQAQLDALDHPGGVAVQVDASMAPNATGTEAEANAALARLRLSVAEGNYAGFAATLRKCLADYRNTKVFPQIVAYTQKVMRDTPPAKLGAALQLQASAARAELDTTTRKIQAIVNQTPPTVVPPRGSREIYHYAFHPGAIKPDFNVADVVTGREAWNGDYVYMDTRPGVFYRSADCEFNPQTKLFYTDRDVPKKKLTDAENQEIVRLYRILGKDETIMEELPRRLADLKSTSADLVALNTQLAGVK